MLKKEIALAAVAALMLTSGTLHALEEPLGESVGCSDWCRDTFGSMLVEEDGRVWEYSGCTRTREGEVLSCTYERTNKYFA